MLPQFELAFFPSQIFWLFVCFGGFFLFVHFHFFPKMQAIFEKREAKIKKENKIYEHNILEAKELEKLHNQMINDTKIEADKKIKQSALKAKQFTEQKQSEIDATLNEKFEIAKKDLINEMKSFEANLNNEILQSASQIIAKIEGKSVAIEDLKKINAKL